MPFAASDFAHGWDDYEWRWKTEQLRDKRIKTRAPVWEGQKIRGSLLVGTQGVGDEIFYSGVAIPNHTQSLLPSALIPDLFRYFSVPSKDDLHIKANAFPRQAF